MNIPRFWEKAVGIARTPNDRDLELTAWGWSHGDGEEARRKAHERLARMIARAGSGELLGKRYPYGEAAALREEIVEEVAGSSGGPLALITRNSYGSLVLNVPNVMFVDVDLPPPPPFAWLRTLFRTKSGVSSEEAALARIREALRRFPSDAFRIYRTAAGFRVMATSREFDPASSEAEAIMRALDADPSFIKLCRAQRSFRARLSAKPWRCGCRLPPGRHPRSDEEAREFQSWLRTYEEKSGETAVCRFIEQTGSARMSPAAAPLLRLHDEWTRAHSALPLA